MVLLQIIMNKPYSTALGSVTAYNATHGRTLADLRTHGARFDSVAVANRIVGTALFVAHNSDWQSYAHARPANKNVAMENHFSLHALSTSDALAGEQRSLKNDVAGLVRERFALQCMPAQSDDKPCPHAGEPLRHEITLSRTGNSVTLTTPSGVRVNHVPARFSGANVIQLSQNSPIDGGGHSLVFLDAGSRLDR